MSRDIADRFPTTTEYLNKVKEAALRARETAIKQNGYWMAQISTFDQNGWPLAEIPNGDKLITSLTAENLQHAAQLRIRPLRLQFHHLSRQQVATRSSCSLAGKAWA